MSPSDKNFDENAILQAANQQLKALNLQLAATEQQLRAANLQLKADEQQLRAANQQLKAGEQQLKAANQQIKTEHQELIQRKTELRRQHTILRTLIDNLPDPVYVKDVNCRFIAANVAVAKHMSAKSPNDLIGKTDADFYPEQLTLKYFNDEQNIIKTGRPLINIEEYSIDGNGNQIWFLASKIPLKDDNGNIIGIVGLGRNITERKLFEHNLTVTNQKLIANKQQLRAANQQLVASEQQLRAANQQLRAEEQQLKAANQQLKAANQQLTANEQQLRALNQQLSAAEKELVVLAKFPAENPNPVIRVTSDGSIIYANKSASQLLDLWETETGQKLPEYWAKLTDEVLRARSPKYVEFEHAGQTYALTFSPIPQAGYLNIYGHDISERKQIEKLLQDSHNKLEQRVKERTAELEEANKKLITEAAERKMIEEKIMEHQEKLRYMTAQLSLSEEHQRKQIAETLHDDAIQTLVFLKMKINDLQELDPSKKYSKTFTHTLDQLNQQTSELIQRLRTLTFDLGSPILYDLGLAAAIKDWLKREIGEKHGIATSFKNEHISKPLNNDLRALLYRAVRELLANVVKHAKAKNINVSKKRHADNIIITVEDDGVGFKHSNEFKYDVATGGYGLFTINERLSQYNGTLKIDSKPGSGTKVILTAPLKFQE